jgi:hypothetical protein
MIEAVLFRARIGLFQRRKLPFSMGLKTSFCKKSRLDLFHGLVLCVLLVIGGVELNPGPENADITIQDLWKQLEKLNSLPEDISFIKHSFEKLTASICDVQKEVKVLKEKCVALEQERNELAIAVDKL